MRIRSFIFLTILIGICGLRFTLLGHGLMHFIDEGRYFSSLEAVKAFSQKNFSEGFSKINSTQGRPGDAVVRLVPAVVQAFLFLKFSINTNTPASLIVPAYINWLVVLLNMYLFYKLSKKLLATSTAQVATIVYACLLNTNVYLRHILPYDAAMTFFFGATILLLYAKQYGATRKGWLLIAGAGVLIGCCYAIYPGYFAAVLMLAIIASEPSWRGSLKRWMVLGAGFAVVLAVFEGLAHLSNTSYLLNSKKLSGTINQGDYSAGFSFVPQYLIQVEGLLGCALLIGLLWACYQLVQSGKMGWRQILQSPPHLVAVSLLLGWLSYASLVYFGHKLVFYGRIVHLFIPFLILLVFYGIAESIKKRAAVYEMVSYTSIMLMSLASFLVFYTTYKPLVYASDVAFAKDIYYPTAATIKYVTTVGSNTAPQAIFQAKYRTQDTSSEYATGDTLVFANFSIPYPVRYIQPIPALKNASLLARGTVANVYPPYQFELYNEFERQLISQKQMEFGIYHISSGKQDR